MRVGKREKRRSGPYARAKSYKEAQELEARDHVIKASKKDARLIFTPYKPKPKKAKGAAKTKARKKLERLKVPFHLWSKIAIPEPEKSAVQLENEARWKEIDKLHPWDEKTQSRR